MSRRKQSSCIIKLFISGGIIAGIITLYLLHSTNYQFKPEIIPEVANKDSTPNMNFTLIDQNGRKFKSSYLEGELSLIYFGVTYSPEDYESMNKLSEIIKVLQKEGITVNSVFITLDAEHDDSWTLKKYLENFNTKFIALTGSSEDIEDVASKFKVFYKPKQFDKETNSYKLEHSNFIYLMSSKGKILQILLPRG
ncbi:SCO family protein [Rickettsia endosymbiont of Halotydeus destructor]|uniref:SCO family protein n=1 Tax=Rickettsia endosymbiont of Halotydeus destructor TaxID=2996754 RepID=UPI003BAF3CC8